MIENGNKDYNNDDDDEKKQKKKRLHFYFCDYPNCDKVFNDKKTHYKHLREHKKLYKCSFNEICNKSFSKKQDVLIHEKIHKNLKNEICKYCDKKFIHPSNLHRHIKYIHNSGIESKPFFCRKCKKQFSRKESLIKHLRSHLNRNDRKIFYCNFDGCDMSFTSKSNRNRHLRVIHDSQNP